MVASALAVIVLGGLIAGCIFLFSSSSSKSSSIPGPKGLPVIGHLLSFWKNLDNVDEWLVGLMKTHGDTIELNMPGKPSFVFTTNPQNVEHVLKTKFTNYEKGSFFRSTLHDLLGNGIFNSDGEHWKPQRKISSNLFNVKNFRDTMIHTFHDHGKVALGLIGQSPADVDVSDLFYRFTLDSIGCIAFGRNIDSLGNPEVEFAKVWDRSNSFIAERFFTISQGIRKMLPVEQRVAKDIVVMNQFAQEILDARKKESPEQMAERCDLLSLFMSKKDVNGEAFSDGYLRDMVLNMILAGRDTTAQSLAWTFYLLAQNPDIQEKAREEVDRVMGADGIPDYDTLKGLEYLHAIVSESLRLYPSVPRDPHECGEDDVLPTGHKVKAGSLVFYFSYGMGRSADIWGDDFAEFRPERFIEDPKLASNPFKFSAFQGGPRTCLGQNMAYLEEQTMLALILQKYSFQLVEGQKVEPLLSLTLPMKAGLRLRFTPRK